MLQSCSGFGFKSNYNMTDKFSYVTVLQFLRLDKKDEWLRKIPNKNFSSTLNSTTSIVLMCFLVKIVSWLVNKYST